MRIDVLEEEVTLNAEEKKKNKKKDKEKRKGKKTTEKTDSVGVSISDEEEDVKVRLKMDEKKKKKKLGVVEEDDALGGKEQTRKKRKLDVEGSGWNEDGGKTERNKEARKDESGNNEGKKKKKRKRGSVVESELAFVETGGVKINDERNRGNGNDVVIGKEDIHMDRDNGKSGNGEEECCLRESPVGDLVTQIKVGLNDGKVGKKGERKRKTGEANQESEMSEGSESMKVKNKYVNISRKGHKKAISSEELIKGHPETMNEVPLDRNEKVGKKEASAQFKAKRKNKRKKDNAEADGGGKKHANSDGATKDKTGKQASRLNEMEEEVDNSKNSEPSKKKRVSFSGHVEMFPSTSDKEGGKAYDQEAFQGKRFSKEDDELVKKAVFDYIKVHGLGEDGVKRVMNCHSHREVRGCWREIASSLPWRTREAVYHRAHLLFERDEERKWTPEEVDIIRRYHAEHGPKWRPLADILGKHRFHVKDKWRRIRLPNQKHGRMSQEEYQNLFDLVNADLKMKAFEEKTNAVEKKLEYGMLKENIAWTAISNKLGTRSNHYCCMKCLLKSDASCVEDVDWDNLLKHRSGEVCRKRWLQMTKYIGGYQEREFVEQLHILSMRYCPELLEYRDQAQQGTV
ncbi:hypothetical protein QJS10_CPA05g02140 [Acorus calamus]|uniref:Uncharacterized protein n=1 Tax=Acorus calamus TaxID=4465 RepID=A0AAV9EWA2_ACOCL|nr:hypothetical protein QJS10_CPA05g02140 [Acorus calamus]